MDIEQKLRELLVPRDPGVTFTDGVLSRVGDVPDAPSGEGVVRLSDARARSRGRRMLIGAVLVASAAAAMLPFLQDRDGGQSVEQEIPSVPVPMGESMEADASLPANRRRWNRSFLGRV